MLSKGLGTLITAFFNSLVKIKWEIHSTPFSSPTNLSPLKTAKPKFSIFFWESIGVSEAT